MYSPAFRLATLNDAEHCYSIEIGSYEGDEAATLEKIMTRISQYPEGFLCMEIDGEVIGFINAGCAWDVVMSDEEFKELIGHDPKAPNAVIMSVVIHPNYQGKGYSTLLMKEFVSLMQEYGKQTIHLMCKEKHVDLYKHFGYEYIQPSESDHGGMVWHEMLMKL